jgi:phenylalanyl-tRNA synthetase beta chain
MLVRRVEDRLAGAARFHQVIGYSFVPDELLAQLGLGAEPHVEVANAIAAGSSKVRRGVVPSLLALVPPNRRRRPEVRLFEVGKGYVPHDGAEPREVHEVAIALSRAPVESPRFDDDAASILRGVVDDLVASLGLEPLAWGLDESLPPPAWALAKRRLVATSGDAVAGELAPLDPGVARSLGLSGDLASETAVARIDLDALLAAPGRAKPYTPVPQFPETLVDVALALPEDARAGDAKAAIERAGKGLVAGLELFDLYAGPNLGPGRKSLAWHVALRADDRTLGEADVRKFLDRLEREATALGGELRRR